MFYWDHTNVVAEYTVSEDNPDQADASSERIISSIDWPQFNHNGHWIGFGEDGYLYISTGDGGYANDWGIGHNVTEGNGQDPTNLHGKILRVDVDSRDSGMTYGIPEDNPFVDDRETLPEIWAMGLRNPWRCSFDMQDGSALICGDVGQNSYETVVSVNAGDNQGWRILEGTHCFDYADPTITPRTATPTGLVMPILEYENCSARPANCLGISVTGGLSTAANTRSGTASTSSATGASRSPRWTARSSSAPWKTTASGRWKSPRPTWRATTPTFSPSARMPTGKSMP
jgi:hypothetical protein